MANITNRYKARNSFLVPDRYNALVKLAKQREELNKGLIDNGNQFPLQTKNSLISNKSFMSDNKKLADEKIDEKSEKSEDSDSEKDKEFKHLKICNNINFNFAKAASNEINVNNFFIFG